MCRNRIAPNTPSISGIAWARANIIVLPLATGQLAGLRAAIGQVTGSRPECRDFRTAHLVVSRSPWRRIAFPTAHGPATDLREAHRTVPRCSPRQRARHSCRPSLSPVACRLTIRSSRRHFVARLNSGVRPHSKRVANLSKWNSPAEWQQLCDGSSCPICIRGQPLDIIATLGASWLTMAERAPMVGYVCLVSRVHAVDLHNLTVAQLAAFMQDAHRVSSALSAATDSVKLNYEIHGNTLPHLHMHFFPRYAGDPFEGRAIEPFRIIHPVYERGQFDALKVQLVRALGAGAA